MRTLLIIALAFLCPFTAKADILPDKVEPQLEVQAQYTAKYHPGFKQIVLPEKPDKQVIIAASVLAAAYTTDMISTKSWIIRCPQCTEAGWFGHGSRDFTKIAVGNGLFDAGLAIAGYEWKEHVHNKVLNKLWITPFAAGTEIHTQATIHNYENLPAAPSSALNISAGTPKGKL